MKKYIYILFLILLKTVSAQSQVFSDDNFVYTVSPKKAVKAANFNTLTKEEVSQSVSYFDGLGRPLQTIVMGQGGDGEDLITPVVYDAFGRQVKEYLPYPVSNGSNDYFRIDGSTAVSASGTFYNGFYNNGSNSFSEKKLENSPLNRVLKQAAPGTSWAMGSGHEIKMEYLTNDENDEVRLFKAVTTWSDDYQLYGISLSDAGHYAENQLYKTVTYDENTTASPAEGSGSTVEFKNKEGQVVLKRTYDDGEKHDTYYVYDDYGNLAYVIPPKAEGTIDDDILNGLCYQYKYDGRNRLAEKKLPGKQWEFIVYDKLDRPVATGPALSPFKGESTIGWIITKYDALGRPVYTGWKNQTCNSAVRTSLQNDQNNASVLFETKQASGTIDGIEAYYSNLTVPTEFKLLTVNYYDNYTFPNARTIPSSVENQTVLQNVKGMATGSWTRALSTASSTAGETSTIFYDDKARPIKNYLLNYLGGYTSSESRLDFTGKTLYTVTKHKRTLGIAETTVREEFTYSAQDRLLTHTHQINGGSVELLAENKYDALGQLESKKVGGSVQKVDYKYNIRGWLKEINNVSDLEQDTDPVDLFAFKINYDTAETQISDVKKLYNGNIAETFWKTASDLNERAYGYKYDKLNRLKNAVYEKNGITTSAYDENLTYDKNGNIKTLSRKGDYDPQVGTIDIDDLEYTYPANSNQLAKVEDNSNNVSGFNDANKTGDDYSYDDNGNLTADKNKNITEITYNHLNLPKKITFGSTGSIEYIYTAAGQKIEKIVTEGTVTTVTNYLGGYQYKDNVLEFFPTAEGYVKNENNALSYVYQYKDHLGNVRLSYARNAQNVLEIIEENNYYPFGLKHKGYNDYSPTANKYKYNGKELQDELGLGVYFFKFRSYDPAIGRFWQIDPLAGTYAHNAPYAFAENNVSSGTDLEGLELSFHLNGSLATAQYGPRVTGGVNGNYTLQELKSHMAQKQAQEDRAMNKLMSGDPRNLPSGEIRPAKGDINTARFDDPGMMIADGARIGAEWMAFDIGAARALGALGKLGSEAKSVWSLGAIQRGRAIEKMLGAASEWSSNFPAVDKVVNGVATSIKSLDLTAKSYQGGNSVFNKLKGYIDKLDKFQGTTWGVTTLEKGADYTSKALELAVQTGKGSESQWNQINEAIKYALEKDINVSIKFIK